MIYRTSRLGPVEPDTWHLKSKTIMQCAQFIDRVETQKVTRNIIYLNFVDSGPQLIRMINLIAKKNNSFPYLLPYPSPSPPGHSPERSADPHARSGPWPRCSLPTFRRRRSGRVRRWTSPTRARTSECIFDYGRVSRTGFSKFCIFLIGVSLRIYQKTQ